MEAERDLVLRAANIKTLGEWLKTCCKCYEAFKKGYVDISETVNENDIEDKERFLQRHMVRIVEGVLYLPERLFAWILYDNQDLLSVCQRCKADDLVIALNLKFCRKLAYGISLEYQKKVASYVHICEEHPTPQMPTSIVHLLRDREIGARKTVVRDDVPKRGQDTAEFKKIKIGTVTFDHTLPIDVKISEERRTRSEIYFTLGELEYNRIINLYFR